MTRTAALRQAVAAAALAARLLAVIPSSAAAAAEDLDGDGYTTLDDLDDTSAGTGQAGIDAAAALGVDMLDPTLRAFAATVAPADWPPELRAEDPAAAMVAAPDGATAPPRAESPPGTATAAAATAASAAAATLGTASGGHGLRLPWPAPAAGAAGLTALAGVAVRARRDLDPGRTGA